jgi:predicted nucleic-acid-binding protein
VQRIKQGRADFSDYLIGAIREAIPSEIARQSGCSETATFDRKLLGEKGFHCL